MIDLYEAAMTTIRAIYGQPFQDSFSNHITNKTTDKNVLKIAVDPSKKELYSILLEKIGFSFGSNHYVITIN